MALKLVTAGEMRRIDAEAIQARGIPALELMERAGAAIARHILTHYDPRRIGIVAGKGNNAADGLVIARHLAEAGREVRVVLLTGANNLGELGKTNYERLPAGVLVLEHNQAPSMTETLADCDLLVDAILGTGITGAPRGSLGEAIAVMNGLPAPIVAVDIPSGLNSNTGLAEGACILADSTVTLGLPKIGMMAGIGPNSCGVLVIEDIGFPVDLLEGADSRTFLLEMRDATAALPGRPIDGHKGTFGSLLVLAGSVGMSGAAYLTIQTALRSGCGMVLAGLPGRVADLLEAELVEAIKIRASEPDGERLTYQSWDRLEAALERVDAIALGPGIGAHEDTARLVDEVVCQDLPMVVDADGLNCLGRKVQYLIKRSAPTVLTPHPGEMGRLLGISTAEIQQDRVATACRLAADSGAVVLLKGARTVIAEPGGRAFINPTGNNGMGKGGSGDVLTGLIGGLLAQGCGALDAACAGAYLHGLAGDLAAERLGMRGMTARDILSAIPEALLACE